MAGVSANFFASFFIQEPKWARQTEGDRSQSILRRFRKESFTPGRRCRQSGLGTFGSDHVTPRQVAEAVKGAAAVGYRHFDCASVYSNELEVGASLEEIQQGGVKREELWITSKLWNDKHAEDDVIASCRKSLADLRLEYLDLYLDALAVSQTSIRRGAMLPRAARDAKPYVHAKLYEDLAEDGRVGGFGVGAPYRYLEYDDSKTETGVERRAHQARGE
jgi:diketogulonate reductase-like aldo/keto reductase